MTRRILLPGDAPVYGPDPTKLNALELYLEYKKLSISLLEEVTQLNRQRFAWDAKADQVKEQAQSLCQHDWKRIEQQTRKVKKVYQVCNVCELKQDIGKIYPNREAAMRSLRREIRAIKAHLVTISSYPVTATRSAEADHLRRRMRELEAEKNRLKYRL